MRPPTTAGAALAALVLSVAVLSGCSGQDGDHASADVEPVAGTEVRAGAVEVVLPAGAATGGRLEVEEAAEPEGVPDGVQPLGPAATVSLVDGTLDGSMTISFDAPEVLAPEHVPVVMAQDGDGGWQWRPTTWDGGDAPVTAQLTSPGEVFLARFDRTPWLADVTEEFAKKANNLAKAPPPACGDEQAAVDDGVQVSSEPGDVLVWCVGVDDLAPTDPSGTDLSAYDEDPYTEGVQTTVLRLTNNSRMYEEVGFPADWTVVESDPATVAGQELRERLGLAGATREGLATRVLGSGDTLTVLLPDQPVGTVTADLSVAAWTLSALDFATATYTRLVSGVDPDLGEEVRGARERLMAEWTAPSTGEDLEDEAGADEELHECLAPVAQLYLLDRKAAEQLVEQASSCAAELLGPAVEASQDGSAQLAGSVASSVLDGLPTTLALAPEPWAQVADVLTDPNAGFQVWLGPPPPQEYDYTDAPYVFRPGDEIAVAEWSPEFTAYVEERLAALSAAGDTAGGTCPDGAFSVERYRTDGFALAGEVTCAGDSWRLVLGRSGDGWQELDDIQQDPYFGCAVLGSYSVPTFIAGETCLDGEQPQEYTG